MHLQKKIILVLHVYIILKFLLMTHMLCKNMNYCLQVVVVSGETGCGKTTQLPQYILESEIEAVRGAACNIICTQPRRISAIAVSERVAAERGEKIGESVSFFF